MASPRPPGATGPIPSPNTRPKSPGKGPLPSPGAARSSAAVRSPPSTSNGRPNPQQGARSPGEAGAARSPPPTARRQSGGPGSAANSPPESPVSTSIKLNLGAKKAPVGGGGTGVINGTSRNATARVNTRAEGIDFTFAGSSTSSYASSSTRAYAESSTVEGTTRRVVMEGSEGGARKVSPTKRPIEAGQLSPSGQPGPNKTTFVTRRPQQGGQGPAPAAPDTSPQVQARGSVSPTRVGTRVTTSTTETTTRTSTSPTRVVTKVVTSTEAGVRAAGTKSPPQSTTTNITRSPGATPQLNGSGFTVQSSRTVGQSGQTGAQSDAANLAAKRRTVVSFADPQEDASAEGIDDDISGKKVTSAKVLRDRRPTGSPRGNVADEQDGEEYNDVSVARSAERTVTRSAADVSGGAARPKVQPAVSPADVSNGAGRVTPKAQQAAALKPAGKSPGTETDDQFQARKNALLSKFKERAGLPFPKPMEADTEAVEGDLGGPEQGAEVARRPTPVSSAMPAISEETPRSMAAMVTPKKEELGVEGVEARVERKKAALVAASARRPVVTKAVVREAQIEAAEELEEEPADRYETIKAPAKTAVPIIEERVVRASPLKSALKHTQALSSDGEVEGFQSQAPDEYEVHQEAKTVPRGSIEATRRAAAPAQQAEESEPALDDEETPVQKRPVSKAVTSAADKSKYNRLKTVLKVEERDLHFNRSGTLAAEKFEWLEVKRKAEEEEELEAGEAEEELEARDDVEELEARATKAVARSSKGKSGRFVFDNEDGDEDGDELSGGLDSGAADSPEKGETKGGPGVLRQLKGVLRTGARAMEVREPSEWGDDDDMHLRDMTSARDMESGAEPVSARAPVERTGPFDGEEALDSPVARNARLGTLKVRTAAALGADRGAGRASDVKKTQNVTSEKQAEKEAAPLQGSKEEPSTKRLSEAAGGKPGGKFSAEDSGSRALRPSDPGQSTEEEEEQPLTGKEMVLAAREYTGTELVIHPAAGDLDVSPRGAEGTDAEKPVAGSKSVGKSRFAAKPAEITVAAAANQAYSAPGQRGTAADAQDGQEGFAEGVKDGLPRPAGAAASARRPRTFAAMGSLKDREGRLKGMESIGVSRRGAQGEWAPGSPRTPLSEQNVRIEFLRNESRPLSPKLKMWSDIKERVSSMLMFKSTKQKPVDESKKRILVIGAECSAGESTLRHLLIRGVNRFAVSFAVPCLESLQRSMTVDLASYHKKYYAQLQAAGADRVEVNMLDERSLLSAMRGVWGVVYAEQWNLYDPEEEILRGKMVANAAFKAGVHHVVYSSAESVRDLQLAGLSRLERDPQWVVPHFDSKGDIEAYMVAIGLPATYLRVAPHYHELLDFCLFRTVGLGTLDVCLPMGSTPFPSISAADVGGCVMKIFEEPGQYSGLCIDLVGSYIPMSDYCKILSEHLGKTVAYRSVTPEWYKENAGYGHAASLANMYSFLREYPEYSMSHVEEAQALYPELQTFEEWMNGTTDVPSENAAERGGAQLTLDIVRDDGLLAGSHAGKKAAFAELLELSDRNQRRTASRRWKNIKASVQTMPLMGGRAPAPPKALPTKWKSPVPAGKAAERAAEKTADEDDGAKQLSVEVQKRNGAGTERIGRPAAAERPALTAGSAKPEIPGSRDRRSVPELMDKPGLPALRDRPAVPAVPELMDKPGLPALMNRAGPREAPALGGRLALATGSV
ncbi:hypothetical protein KFL_000320400 [Klebsormidium nitens]|uniref:NmrA-like domain-containing protein n=1 Tax=Klebsormidium nitens TaxID=105231 RepID=A0A1Y1HP30_KLENI|nr:hypothetical protein KFL_000320400 [Klebsormidium nitens]|eukprot:GAQ79542.1 hypothetical protein KFL_000320400 [Klebsormidium nitens]